MLWLSPHLPHSPSLSLFHSRPVGMGMDTVNKWADVVDLLRQPLLFQSPISESDQLHCHATCGGTQTSRWSREWCDLTNVLIGQLLPPFPALYSLDSDFSKLRPLPSEKAARTAPFIGYSLGSPSTSSLLFSAHLSSGKYSFHSINQTTPSLHPCRTEVVTPVQPGVCPAMSTRHLIDCIMVVIDFGPIRVFFALSATRHSRPCGHCSLLTKNIPWDLELREQKCNIAIIFSFSL